MSNTKQKEEGAAAESAAPVAAPPVVALSIDMLQAIIEKAVAAGVGAAASQMAAGTDASKVAASDSTTLELMKGMIELSRQQSEQAKNYNDAQRRQVRPSNSAHENVSVFNHKPGCPFCEAGTRHPEALGGMLGHQKPQFVIQHIFWPRGCPAVADDFTVAEIELINDLIAMMIRDGIEIRTARHGTLTATLSRDHKKLEIDAPVYFTDQRHSLPELVMLLVALIQGTEVMTPESMYARMAKLQAEVARLTSMLPPAAVPA